MASLLISLRPIRPYLHRSLRQSPESTYIVASLLVSLRPLCIELIDSPSYGSPSWQPSAYTALAVPQPLANADPTTFMVFLLVSLRPLRPYLHRSLQLRPGSTAIVASLLVIFRPLISSCSEASAKA